MGILTGGIVKFVAGNVTPAIKEIEKQGYEVESFNLTLRGPRGTGVSVNFRKKK